MDISQIPPQFVNAYLTQNVIKYITDAYYIYNFIENYNGEKADAFIELAYNKEHRICMTDDSIKNLYYRVRRKIKKSQSL